MSDVVLDASVMASWLLPDEQPEAAQAFFDDTSRRLRVPGHFPAEIGNVIRQSVRRGRITMDDAARARAAVVASDITVEPVAFGAVWLGIAELADRHDLTFYDAAYLDLALRTRVRLATFDRDLIKAAQREGLPLAL